MNTIIKIQNKKAGFEYHFLETYIAGVVLLGTEVKSIRNSKVNLTDAFCSFHRGELFLRNATIQPYDKGGNYYNHAPKRDRKLLLKSTELKKIVNKLKDIGLTIVPIDLFMDERGFVKVTIAVAKGKKLYDKREDIKKKDITRQMNREEA